MTMTPQQAEGTLGLSMWRRHATTSAPGGVTTQPATGAPTATTPAPPPGVQFPAGVNAQNVRPGNPTTPAEAAWSKALGIPIRAVTPPAEQPGEGAKMDMLAAQEATRQMVPLTDRTSAIGTPNMVLHKGTGPGGAAPVEGDTQFDYADLSSGARQAILSRVNQLQHGGPGVSRSRSGWLYPG